MTHIWGDFVNVIECVTDWIKWKATANDFCVQNKEKRFLVNDTDSDTLTFYTAHMLAVFTLMWVACLSEKSVVVIIATVLDKFLRGIFTPY